MKAPRLLLAAALPLMAVSCQNNPFAQKPADPYAQPYGADGGYNPYGTDSGYGQAPAYNQGSYAQQPAPSYSQPSYSQPSYTPPPSDPYAYDPPPPSPEPSYSPPSSGGSTHTVVRGDTLYSLARRYGTTVSKIKSANGLSSDLIVIGQRLRIP
ncbi:MAG: LysM peptidoglycan-binding domain-containing protein [Verrucomicrobiales bacterium]|nr:LysM peptidoglycan-binding domain-containing protein [Verrucomicrobiales bacterium]